MKTVRLTVVVEMRWWLPLYLQSVCLFAFLMDAEPDWDRIDKWIQRGIVAKVRQHG